MSAPPIPAQRISSRTLIARDLRALVAATPATLLDQLSESLEAVIAGVHGANYTATVTAVLLFLSARDKIVHPDDLPAFLFVSGKLSPAEVVAGALANVAAGRASAVPDSRQVCRQMFALSVIAAIDADPDCERLSKEEITQIATEIERGCYEATIQICRDADEPPHRSWANPAFVDIYSGRCGTVDSLIRPDSITVQAYPNAKVMARLIRGFRHADVDTSAPRGALGSVVVASDERLDFIRPEKIGWMASREICPESFAEQMSEIEKRSVKVELKESILFVCTHCKARRCTYQQVQDRGPDEAPSYYCFCLNCKRRFKGN